MFADRTDAGAQLASLLGHLKAEAPIVLALPRGGVPVAFEIARRLDAPLGLVFVRKLGAPINPEFAVGAVADGGDPVVVLHDRAIAMLGLTRDQLEPAIARDLNEIRQRRSTYGPEAVREDLAGRTTILVDDGIATGATMEAAIRWARRKDPSRVVVAVPVAAPDTVKRMGKEKAEVVCVHSPRWLTAVGSAYTDFTQVDDATVTALLRRAAAEMRAAEKAGPADDS